MLCTPAQASAAAEILIEELAVIDPEARHLQNFVYQRLTAPLLGKTKVVTETLGSGMIADGRIDLPFGPRIMNRPRFSSANFADCEYAASMQLTCVHAVPEQ